MGLKDAFKTAVAKQLGISTEEINQALDKIPYVDRIGDKIEDIKELKDAFEMVTDIFDSMFTLPELRYFIAGIKLVPNYLQTPLANIVHKLEAVAKLRGEEGFSSENIASASTATNILTPPAYMTDAPYQLRTSLEDTEAPIADIPIEPSLQDINIPESIDLTGKNFTFNSPPNIDINKLNEQIIIHNLIHIGVSLAITTIQVIAEVSTAGFVDQIIPALSVVYNLLPSSNVYNQVMAIETETSLMRPFRYAKEAEHMSQIPPWSDIIRMVAKEQFGDTPNENKDTLIKLGKYYGFNPFFTEAYWGSHWDLPNTSELFAMFGRGIINEEELRTQLTINDIHPKWIDRIKELSVRFPSRTEARLINRVRKLSKEQITKILDNERIHEDYKEDYAFFLNNQELDTIRLQMAREYNKQQSKGYISSETLTTKLSRIPFSSEELGDLQSELNDFVIEDSPYSALEILATRKLNDLKMWTEIKDTDLHSIKNRFLWEFKQDLMTKEEFRIEVSKIIVNVELADSIADNIMARAKTDFGLNLLEALGEE